MIGIREMPLIYIFLPILGYALFKRGQLLKQALKSTNREKIRYESLIFTIMFFVIIFVSILIIRLEP